MNLSARGIALRGTAAEDEVRLVVDSPDRVVNEADADPRHASTVWQGPRDASAVLRIAGDAKALRLRAEIRDDVHVDPGPAPAFAGDGLRILLADAAGSLLGEVFLAEVAGVAAAAVLHPPGLQQPPDALAPGASRSESRLVLSATVPFEIFGIGADALRRGVRLNVVLTDRDGEEPGSRLFAAGGATGARLRTEDWPVVYVPDAGLAAEAGHQ